MDITISNGSDIKKRQRDRSLYSEQSKSSDRVRPPATWKTNNFKVFTPINRSLRRETIRAKGFDNVFSAEDAAELKLYLATDTFLLSAFLSRPFSYFWRTNFYLSGVKVQGDLMPNELAKHLNGSIKQFFSDLILSKYELPMVVFDPTGEIEDALRGKLSSYLQFEMRDKLLWFVFMKLKNFLNEGRSLVDGFPGRVIWNNRGIVVESTRQTSP
jgi:hypothetical protein